VHLDCSKAYFETDDLLDRLIWFSSALSEAERDDLRRASWWSTCGSPGRWY